MLQNALMEVDAVTMDFQFDTSMLQYQSYQLGSLGSSNWLSGCANEITPGTVRFGSYAIFAGIQLGSSGIYFSFTFLVSCETCNDGDFSSLILTRLLDDVSTFYPDPGIFTYHTAPTPTPLPTMTPTPAPTATLIPLCSHTGDVDFNLRYTAADAQKAFGITLGYFTPTYLEACAADCNGDDTISMNDVQTIFYATLGLGSCIDPIGSKTR